MHLLKFNEGKVFLYPLHKKFIKIFNGETFFIRRSSEVCILLDGEHVRIREGYSYKSGRMCCINTSYSLTD